MRNNTAFQTPPAVCDYMVSLVAPMFTVPRFLEPTPGAGNLVKAIEINYPKADITAPIDFWKLDHEKRYDHIVMNPPFSPMKEGWRYLEACMNMSDDIVALLPWFIFINSKRRSKAIMDFGLQSITHLPRETFPNSRIQCCIMHLVKRHTGHTIFKNFEF